MNDVSRTPPDPDRPATPAALIDAACDLFAARGYDGASIRAITDRADANLGAVTYHFGSKEALYHAVIESKVGPLKAKVVGAAGGDAPPLERILEIVAILFDHYAEDPGLPRLILQQVASGQPPPPPARSWIRTLAGTLGLLVQEGQADGTIRDGDPRFLALGVVPPAVFVHLIRQPLEESLDLSLDDPETRDSMRAHVLDLVRSALEAR